MNYLKRFLYLLYYLKETDFFQLRRFIRYAGSGTGRSGISILLDTVSCVFKYNISPKDYFCFRFFEQDREGRNTWAGSGFMYEYQLKMNPKGVREVLENKIKFLEHFKSFVKREYCSISQLKSNKDLAGRMLSNPSGRLVLKNSYGQVGAEVEVIDSSNFTTDELLKYMDNKKYDLAEEFVTQHHSLMELSPTGLNTVRIFTQLDKEKVNFLGARLRISVNSMVDNMGAGNLAAPLDINTGKVTGPGVYSDITKEDKAIHPVTGKTIEGFVIPGWDVVRELAINAALNSPENKSVGWDIAITENGPELIEGNHNWCRLLWQMPVKMGLKNELEKYL